MSDSKRTPEEKIAILADMLASSTVFFANRLAHFSLLVDLLLDELGKSQEERERIKLKFQELVEADMHGGERRALLEVMRNQTSKELVFLKEQREFREFREFLADRGFES